VIAQDIRAAIAHRRAEAEQRLVEAVGAGGSLCAIGRGGGSFPAVKYHEGAVAALAEAARTVGDLDSLSRLLQRWRESGSGATADAPDWIAYRTGGVEALESVMADS
jgi:hypothetical protein